MSPRPADPIVGARAGRRHRPTVTPQGGRRQRRRGEPGEGPHRSTCFSRGDITPEGHQALEQGHHLSHRITGAGAPVGVAPGEQSPPRSVVHRSMNPCCSRMRQTSRPDRTRSLPIENVERRHEHAGTQALGDLLGVGRVKEDSHCLTEVRGGLFDRRALARDVEFGGKARRRRRPPVRGWR